MTRFAAVFFVSLLCLLLSVGSAWTAEKEPDGWSPRQKVLTLNLGAVGAIAAWGLISWDYGSSSPHMDQERWFGHGTLEGGADKLGHMYTSYALSHGLSTIYRAWDYPPGKAAAMGALSSFTIQGMMELMDSFTSSYGFSYEDMVMNTAGVLLGYTFDRHPDWQRKIDFRLEYKPSLGKNFESDVFTDYQSHKYLLALKGEGFSALNQTFLRYLELQVGYTAKGYADYAPGGPDDRRRSLYAGVGLNVGELVRPLWDSRIFNYLQIPYTSLHARKKLD